MKLNKTDIADVLFEKGGFTRRESDAAVDLVFETMRKAMLAGEEINISNFGRFVPIEKQSRIGTNPNSHTQIEIPSKKTVVFHPAKTLKASLNK